MKRVTGVAVGEKHSLALQSWCAAPTFHAAAPSTAASRQGLSPQGSRHLEEADLQPCVSADDGPSSERYWDRLDTVLQNLTQPPQECDPTLRPALPNTELRLMTLP